jgi:hypothetical protein
MPIRAPASETFEEALDRQAPRWCPWLYAIGPRLQAIVAEVTEQALAAEERLGLRKRARRPADLAVFMRTVGSLISHAVYEAIRGAGPVRLSLSNRDLRCHSRYLSDLHSKQLPGIVRLLSSAGYLSVTEGQPETPFSPGRQTRVAATPRLLSMIDGVGADDIARSEGEELVLLRCDRTEEDEAGRPELKEYDDTEDTNAYRAEVRELNAWLASADVTYTGSDSLVDPRKRYLQRRFTRGDVKFGNGGRLYGGFWIPFHKGDRVTDIRINGEEVVEIDFSATFLQLAYAYARTEPPEGDLYQITFSDTSGATVDVPRDLIKSALSARFNGAKGWPDDCRKDHPESVKVLPWRRFVDCAKAAHPAIALFMDRDCGQEFTFTESEILIDALLAMKRQDVVALPVHDCIVVPASAEVAGVSAMLEAFRFHTGNEGRLKVKRAEHATVTSIALSPAERLRIMADAANF